MFRTVRSAIIVAGFSLACADASAQLKVGGGGIDVAAPTNTTAVQSDTAGTVRDTRRTGGHTLRCWQNGRLLYEGSGFRGSLANASAINVPRRGGEGDAVTVLNLTHAICILADG